MERRASKVDREGNEFGHMATIEGLTVDNPRKLRGGRVERLIKRSNKDNCWKFLRVLVTAHSSDICGSTNRNGLGIVKILKIG